MKSPFILALACVAPVVVLAHGSQKPTSADVGVVTPLTPQTLSQRTQAPTGEANGQSARAELIWSSLELDNVSKASPGVVARSLSLGSADDSLDSTDSSTGQLQPNASSSRITTSEGPAEAPTEENMNMSLLCPSTFDVEFFKVFLDEECLAKMKPRGELVCPLKDAEDFFSEVFGEFHVLSVCSAPLFLYVYMTIGLFGNVPKTSDDTGSKGMMAKLLYSLWLVLQAGTCFFQTCSLIWFVFGYMNMSSQLGSCFHEIGSVPVAHLTMVPLGAFQMAAINRLAPLAITVSIVIMELQHHMENHDHIDLARLVGKAAVAAGALPFLAAGLYATVTLSVIFSAAFLPLCLCTALLVVVGRLLLLVPWASLTGLLWRLRTEYQLDLIWFLNDDREMAYDPLFCVAAACLIAMLLAPFFSFGAVLAFVVYGGGDGGQVIQWIYEYVVTPTHFQVPSFVALAQAFDGSLSDTLALIYEVDKVLDLPPQDVIVASVAFSAIGTFLSALRSLIMGINSILFALNGQKWGYATCKLNAIRKSTCGCHHSHGHDENGNERGRRQSNEQGKSIGKAESVISSEDGCHHSHEQEENGNHLGRCQSNAKDEPIGVVEMVVNDEHVHV